MTRQLFIVIIFSILTVATVFGQTKSKSFNAGGYDFQATTVDNTISEAFYAIGEMPKYPGGYDSLATFLRRQIKYPKSALQDSVQGKVMIRFTVDTTGTVINATVINSVRSDLDSICLSAAERLPKWTAGRLDGKPVAVYFNLPIKFRLSDFHFYFPSKLLGGDDQWLDSFLNKWYSEQLFAMREPIIFSDKSNKEIYRFTWLRTFDNPIAIRIEKQDSTYLLFWKVCNGAGGYEPGQLTENKQKTIDKETWDKFKSKLNDINFWNLPTKENEIMGTDGSQWILEGKKDSKYHTVDRWSPSEKGKYYQCCDFLIGLTDLKIKADDKY